MSGIQKSFVIKNGLEVATNVLLVNSTTRKVGIGSTHPQYDLDVRGGIGVTDINAVGVITALSRLNVGTNGSTLTAIGGSYVGVGTNNPAYLLDVRSPVSTGQTALYVYGDLRVTGDVNIDDISITNLNVSGVSTFVGFATFRNNIFVAGIGTITNLVSTSGTIANLTGTSGTITTFNSTTGNITNLTNTNLNVTGVATIATLNATGIGVTNFTVYNALSVGGISTFTNGPVLIGSGTSTGTASQRLQVTGGTYVSGNLGIGSTNPTSKLDVIGDVIVTGVITATTFVGALTGTATSTTNIPNLIGAITSVNTTTSLGSFTSAQLATALTDETGSGSAVFATSPTLVTPVLGSASATSINVTGISTLGTLQVSSGVVTATVGVVTYYGDGRYLSNVTSGVGLGTTGGMVGYGATILYFSGPGISTITVSAGIGTINIVGGVGGATIGVGSTFVGIPTSGNLWYNTDYGRMFIYYQDIDSSQWVDASPFNVGIITSLTNISFNLGTASAPSLYFAEDQQTGLFSPGLGQQTFVSTGASILNINAGGINVTGIVTATDFNSTSDIKLKENINTVNNALLKVEQLRGVSFDWKETGRSSYGVIAQELEEVLPELVGDGEVKSVNYSGIIGVLIEAIKELRKEIEDLKNTK